MRKYFIICILFILLITGTLIGRYFIITNKQATFTYNGYEINYKESLFKVDKKIEPIDNTLLTQQYKSGKLILADINDKFVIDITLYDSELLPSNAYGGIVAVDENSIEQKLIYRQTYELALISGESEIICLKDAVTKKINCKFYSNKINTEYPEIYSFYTDESGKLLFPEIFNLLGMKRSSIMVEFNDESDVNEKQLEKVLTILDYLGES